nr:retrotransposon protein, putative, Ty1-copia subclass [Tanacetum cinerariifolium]
MGYYFYFSPENKIVVVRYVEFFEKNLITQENPPPNCKTVGKTLSPIANIRAIGILISIVVYYDYEIWKMDVKTAFLNGYLDEDIFMVQPKGFVDPNHPRKRYKMDNSRRGHIPMQERLDLNKTQGASTPKENLGELHWTAVKNIPKRGHIPMQERLDLNKTQGASTPKEVKRMQNVPYALAMGSIMYAVRSTRPDVAFA